MTPETLTILGMTGTILIASWTMNRSLRADLKADIKDVRNEIKATRTELREDIQAIRSELTGKIGNLSEAQHGLNERMAGVEGLVMGLKEAIVARAVA